MLFRLATIIRLLAKRKTDPHNLLREILFVKHNFVTIEIEPVIRGSVYASRLAAFLYAREVASSYYSLDTFFERHHKDIMAMSPNISLIKTNQRMSEAIRKTVVSISAQPLPERLGDSLNPAIPGGASYPIINYTRGKLNEEFRDEQLRVASPIWTKSIKWNLSDDHPEKDECNLLALADNYDLGKGVYPVKLYPVKPHFGCFPGDQLVTARNVRAATKRWYCGEIVHVFTGDNSSQLSGTPNHPALTPNGWVPIGELREGDYVFSGIDGKSSSIIAPDYENVPTRIDEVYESIIRSLGMGSVTMPITSEDFHGDGTANGYVDIVRTNRIGELSSILNHFIKPTVSFSDIQLLLIDSLSSFDPPFSRILDSSTSFMGSGSHLLDLFWGMEVSSLLLGSHSKLSSSEFSSDISHRDTSNGRNLVKTLPREIKLHRVIQVTGSRFRGHVYNLQTESGSYTCNNVTVHNCLCYVTYLINNDLF